MVNRALLIGLLTLLGIPTHSQENNVSFFSEGKVWNYLEKTSKFSDIGAWPYTISVIKQTTYNDFEAWIVSDGKRGLELVEYEKDLRVYYVGIEGELKEEYNFDLQLGDEVECHGQVVAIDYITVKGCTRKRFTLLDQINTYYIVEGIGQNLKISYRIEDGIIFTSSACYELQSVYENGECIFTKEDFFAEPATDIQEIEAGQKTDTRIYDLSGRPVTTPRPNGLYIRNRQVFRQPKH